jgi:tetratricopeptide (TPR) repeat protein/CHAT domain-containing protein
MIGTQLWLRARKTVPAVFVYALLMSSRVWTTPALALQQATPPQALPTAGAESAESELKALVQRYYDAVARKDVEAVGQTWHSGGPARAQRNIVVMDFELRDITLTALTLSGVAADANGGRARVVADLTITTVNTQKTRRERRVRDMTFLPEAGIWKIWNEASAGAQLAQRLLSVSDVERDRLIASEPELVSDDALIGLSREVARLRGEGISPRILEVLALQGRLARAVGNTAVLARSLLDAGLIHQITGNPEPAAPAFAEARDAFVEVGDASEVAACDTNLGNVAYLLRDYPAAFEYYQKALGEFESLKDEPSAASLRHSLGNVYFVQGDFERAIESYQQGLAVFERTGDTFAAARVLQALGQVYKELGSYGPAAEAWGRCVDLSLKTGDMTGAATALQTMGEVRRLQGDFSRALESYTKSLALWEKTPDVRNRAGTLFAIGQIHAAQRSFTKAVEWYQKALDLDQNAALDVGIARDFGGLGGAHLALGQPVVALEEYQKSLTLREKLQDTPGVMWTLVHIGVLHAREDRHPDALTAFQRSLDVAEREKDLAAISTVMALRARSLLASRDIDASLAAAARATEVATGIDLFDVIAHARVTTGRAHRQAGRADQARVAFEEAVAALANVSTEPGAETFFDDRRSPYLAMVDLLVGEHKGAEAFLWSERLRQRALADLLGSDGVIVTKGLNPAERDEERRLKRESRTLSVRIRRERARATPSADRVSELQAKFARLQTERDTARRAMYEGHPALKILRGQGDPLGVEGATTLLADSKTAVVSYVVSEARTWVFVIALDPVSGQPALQQTATIEITADDLLKSVDAFVRAVATKGDEASDASRALRKLLVDPVQTSLAGRSRIVVIPDAFVWTVPFEALQNASGRYLIEDASVSYGLSVTALAALAALPHPRPHRPSVVAVANPRLQKSAEERVALTRPASVTLSDNAEHEVRGIATLFGSAASRVLLGDKAGTARILRETSSGAILHVAAPVFVSNASPLFSMMTLTSDDNTDADGGLVEIADVLGWELPAEAVVFSRVDSGVAPVSQEGFAGLSWCLFVAGAPVVVANRWVLQDAVAAALVPSVYRARLAPVAGRHAGWTMAESVQQAAKRHLAQPATRHPYYWAGLIVIGT